ncbi:NrdR family transcriptional regulator [Amphibacillus xylanus]
MKCPVCNNKTRITNSRSVANTRTRRMRECVDCLTRFKTIEIMEYTSLPDYILSKLERRKK